MASPPSSSPTFSVRRCQPELITPAKPTPRELKKLSDIDDQEGLRFQISFIMFYCSIPSMEEKDPVGIIREALGKALVFYYPYAGRIIQGPNRKLMVDCNGEGILFIEADADITIEQLGDSIQPPCPCIEELLYDVPGSAGILGCPLLLIQVTRLACGGFIFAIRTNHTISDSFGLPKFLNATAEFAKGATKPSLFPVWQRELLFARNPPRVTCVHHEYEDTNNNTRNYSMLPANMKIVNLTLTEMRHSVESVNVRKANNTVITLDQPNMVHSSFLFGPKETRSLRKHLPPHLRNCTNFEMIAACMWKCRILAFELDPTEVVRLSCIMNVGIGKQGLQMPRGYYGNSFVFPAVVSSAQFLCKNPLGYAVELVRKCKKQMNEEYVRSVTDLMVIQGRPNFVTRWNFLVVDTSRSGLADIDFGWGKPIYGGPIGGFPYISTFARFRKRNGEDGIVVPIWLPKPVMERFKHEILKMTQESTGSLDDTLKTRIASKL
ncbi:hypothetical protein GH714_041610 [Hevea brasiliensis]|uniref:Uncharacterized protein n=1 Tax=Hevea brasiliensis TaxID=3981 RepID=A0A6A6MWG9_HEVBR|nr:hypothetical protein GH714_041610 [Hevea brasiliensis]